MTAREAGNGTLVDLPGGPASQSGRSPIPAGELPVLLSQFVGREREIATVSALLRRADVRLVTLTGPGGVGKTRLALRVATALRASGDFADGLCFVPLAPIRSSNLVLTAIAHAAGLRDEGRSPLFDQVRKTFIGKRQLLVVDNVEHVAAAAPLLAELLAACPGLTMLATSRAVLRLTGEHGMSVPPLMLPDLARLPEVERLSHYEAVRLFVNRASAAKAGFVLTEENAVAVASICHRVDGLPLAIELAAARIQHLTPAALLSRLEHRLPLLIGGAIDQPVRLQTMRSTIAWSYDLLDPQEQTLFRRLAVFVGGFTLDAAEAGGDEAASSWGGRQGGKAASGSHDARRPTLDSVSSLVDQSLLKQVEPSDGRSESGLPRYAMLETVREFGLEQLAACGDEDEAREGHAGYFLDLAEEAAEGLRGGEQLAWLERLETEIDNVRAALGWSLTRDDRAMALRMVGALHWFWHLHGHFVEGRGWLEAALARSTPQVPPEILSRALTGAGLLALLEGDVAAARARAEEGAAIARAAGDRVGAGYALHFLGAASLLYEEDARTGERLLPESVAYFRDSHDRWGLALTLCGLGILGVVTMRLDEARESLEESRRIFQQLGDNWGLARVLNHLGEVARAEGEDSRARALYEEALVYYRDLGYKTMVATVLQNLGYLAQREGDLRRGVAYFAEANELGRINGDMRVICHGLAGVAGMAGQLGHPEAAARLLGAAEVGFAETGASMWSIDRIEHERNVAAVRALMGNVAFDAAREAGKELAQDRAFSEAAELARIVCAPVETTGGSSSAYDSRLTRREREVLRLLVDGRSDREIAAALSISHRTVARHMTGILSKLGVSSRTAAATLAVRQGIA